MIIAGSPASRGWFRSMERATLFRCGLSVLVDWEGKGCTVHFWGVHTRLSQSEARERFFCLVRSCLLCSSLTPALFEPPTLSTLFLHFVAGKQVEYGSDSTGSGFPDRPATSSTDPAFGTPEYLATSSWNIKNVAFCEGSTIRHVAHDIPGINQPWLYWGMTFATFCW